MRTFVANAAYDEVAAIEKRVEAIMGHGKEMYLQWKAANPKSSGAERLRKKDELVNQPAKLAREMLAEAVREYENLNGRDEPFTFESVMSK